MQQKEEHKGTSPRATAAVPTEKNKDIALLELETSDTEAEGEAEVMRTTNKHEQIHHLK